MVQLWHDCVREVGRGFRHALVIVGCLAAFAIFIGIILWADAWNHEKKHEIDYRWRTIEVEGSLG